MWRDSDHTGVGICFGAVGAAGDRADAAANADANRDHHDRTHMDADRIHTIGDLHANAYLHANLYFFAQRYAIPIAHQYANSCPFCYSYQNCHTPSSICQYVAAAASTASSNCDYRGSFCPATGWDGEWSSPGGWRVSDSGSGGRFYPSPFFG